MARRLSMTQLRSQLRQVQQKRRQAVDRYNQGVRRYNSRVRQAVGNYNQAARAYNSRVRANRQRLRNELTKLSNRSTTTQYVVFRTSVHAMHEAYTHLERRADAQRLGPQYNQVLDLSERETANSLGVMNCLLGVQPERGEEIHDLQQSTIADELQRISPDLDSRWKGAIFSLNPGNPDAARHFCTSTREILTQVLAINAPDEQVLSAFPNCETHQGRPTRRESIKYCLHRKGISDDALEDFVEQDMENIVQLFGVLNDGTHGSAGRFDLQQLSSIKKRVEDGVLFLVSLAE